MLARKKRGPPATGKGQQIVVRLQPDMLAELDAWISELPDNPKPSRPEAMRQIIKFAMNARRPDRDHPSK